MQIGEVYGRGTVVDLLPRPPRARLVCSCGGVYTARRDNVVAGRSSSCGCIAEEQAVERAKAKASLRAANRATFKAAADVEAGERAKAKSLRRAANRSAKADADVAAALAMRTQEDE